MSFAMLAAAFAGAARADDLDSVLGKALFDRIWIPAPASTDAADGLGPLFTARSCASCHAGGGGSTVIRRAGGETDIKGAVVRFGTRAGAPDPHFGRQLQTNVVPGLVPEGQATFLPKLHFRLNAGALHDAVRAGARVAPPLFGVAGFDDVANEEILARADPSDRNSDGVSGRANVLPDGRLGRYGWKASQPDLQSQIADALVLDLGLSSPPAPQPAGDCTPSQTECLSAPTGESPAFDNREVSPTMIAMMAAYLKTLRYEEPPAEAPGAAQFSETGCAACHTPSLATRSGARIAAFTDLLLHDMGPDLDDGVGEPGVASSEWRTAPLAGLGRRKPPARYLHDGSAASIEEAIAKHGGEGDGSRARFNALSDETRQRLIDYVKGL